MEHGIFNLKATVKKRALRPGIGCTHGSLTLGLDGGGSVVGETKITYITDGKKTNLDWHSLRKDDEVLVTFEI